MLESVELRHIDIYETDFGVLKRSLGSAGEITVARSDPDH